MDSKSIKKHPKILYFSSSRNIGFTYHLSEFARTIGDDPDFLFVSGELEQFPGIFSKLEALNINRAIIPSLDTSKDITHHLSKLRMLIRKFNPDIIHTQTNYQLLLASILKPFYRFKIVQTIHAFENGKGGAKMHLVKLYLTTMCAIFARKVIFQSLFVQNNFKLLRYKSCNLPMGFETPTITLSKNTPPPFQIIYAAKFHEAKNHKWLIETLEPLLFQNEVNLILPGSGEDFHSIQQLVAHKNLSKQVKLPGWINRDEMTKAYNSAHLAVVPSRSETLGHNIIEPLAYGIPVISFPVGIAPDIAKTSDAVQIVDFYAADQIVATIKLHISNITNYNKIAKRASDYFYSNLTWDIHVKKYKNFLNEL